MGGAHLGHGVSCVHTVCVVQRFGGTRWTASDVLCMDVQWMRNACLDGWMHALWMDGWMDGCMHVLCTDVYGMVDGCLNGCMHVLWIDGWTFKGW